MDFYFDTTSKSRRLLRIVEYSSDTQWQMLSVSKEVFNLISMAKMPAFGKNAQLSSKYWLR